VAAEQRSQLTQIAMVDAIHAALTEDGITQAEFARLVGCSEKHLSQVLAAKVFPPIATLDYWAFALGRRWKIQLEVSQ
jgi:transcriptional regulator with XRE-family HTH domain